MLALRERATGEPIGVIEYLENHERRPSVDRPDPGRRRSPARGLRERGDERRLRARPPELGLPDPAGRDRANGRHRARDLARVRALRRDRPGPRRRRHGWCCCSGASSPLDRTPGTRSLGRGRGARGDHAGREVARDHRVRPDDGALADRDAAGDDAVRAEPAVVADRHGALRAACPAGSPAVGVVEAVVGVGEEAVVGEHAMAADLDPLVRGDHAAEVQDRALADRIVAVSG